MTSSMDTSGPLGFCTQYTVVALKEGNCRGKHEDHQSITPSCTLVMGPHNILVGTGLPQEKEVILAGLQQHGVNPDNIEYVVCPQGSVEYVGNLNLFPNATHFVGMEIMRGSQVVHHSFKEDIPFEIDDDVQVVHTPGPHHNSVSLLVSNSNLGTTAITGSLFQCEEDLEDSDIWTEQSYDSYAQQQSRIEILKIADHIVPRYGKLFRVPDSYKGTELKVVMTP